jgi:hypothetical protein
MTKPGTPADMQGLANAINDFATRVRTSLIPALDALAEAAESYRRACVRHEYQHASWWRTLWIEHRETLRSHEKDGTWYVTPEWLREGK